MSVIGKISGPTDGPLNGPAVWEIVKVALGKQLEFDPANKASANQVKVCQTAISTLVASTTTTVTLVYSSGGTRMMGIPSNMQELVDAIIAGNATLVKVNAGILDRKAKESADAADALVKARAEFAHLQNGTAAGHYGEKLRGLIQSGHVKLAASPHKTYMSSYEKGQSRDGIAKAPFGCSRRIIGVVAAEWPADKKLVLHQHCSWTGGITAASIKYESVEELGGGGLHLEESALPFFEDPNITRAKVM